MYTVFWPFPTINSHAIKNVAFINTKFFLNLVWTFAACHVSTWLRYYPSLVSIWTKVSGLYIQPESRFAVPQPPLQTLTLSQRSSKSVCLGGSLPRYPACSAYGIHVTPFEDLWKPLKAQVFYVKLASQIRMLPNLIRKPSPLIRMDQQIRTE